MSDEISQAMAADISLQHEHCRNVATLRGCKPDEDMKMNWEELLRTLGELTHVPPSQEAMTPSDQSLRIAYLGTPYPPCILALSELQPIFLSDMELETNHRGRTIILKTLAEPKDMGSLVIATEDGNADVCAIALFHSRSTANTLQKNTLLAVKEPYFTLSADGIIMIRIDHLSDLVRLETDSWVLPVNMTTVPIPLYSPTERQHMGDDACQHDDLRVAVNHYTRGLEIKQYHQEIRCTLHLSRAEAYFTLGDYELALEDAVAATALRNMSDNTGDRTLKAFLLAGQAAYELGDYIVAKKYFTRGLEIAPDADHALTQIRRIQDRLAEENTGDYDFDAMSKSITKDRSDHASFLKNTEIASAGIRGRGLFAARPLAPGELVIVEKAFFIASDNDALEDVPIVVDLQGPTPRCYRGRYAERIYGATEKILRSPKQAAKFLDLYDGGSFDRFTKVVDSTVTVDTFRVEAITRLNAFARPAASAIMGDESDATGIWLHASHANHSCVPNTDRTFIGNMIIFRANRAISAGEEICTSYCNQDEPYSQRNEHLRPYGFECDCPLCGVEATIPMLLKKRAGLVDESNNFITTHMASEDLSKLPRTTVCAAEELLRQLEGTYPDSKYHRLPRLECVPFSYWLCLISGTPEERLRRALNALRNHGYFVRITDRTTIDRATAVPLGPAIKIALIAAAAGLQLGKAEAACELQKLRKEIYVVINGSERGFDDMDGQFGV